LNGGGKRAGKLQRFAVDDDAGDALGAILIGLAEADVFVERATVEARLGVGFDKQALLDGLGCGRDAALLGFRFCSRRGEELAVQAKGFVWIFGGPAEDYASFDHFGGEVFYGRRRLAGENNCGVGKTGGATVVVDQFNKITERTRRALRETQGQRFIEGARGVGSQMKIAGNSDADAIGVFAADVDRDRSFQKHFVGVFSGHLPGERDLVAGADRS
jgi:hypothetical protein